VGLDYRKVLRTCAKIFVYSIVGWEGLRKWRTSFNFLWLCSLYFSFSFVLGAKNSELSSASLVFSTVGLSFLGPGCLLYVAFLFEVVISVFL